MARLGRRQQKKQQQQASEHPIFSDAHSIDGVNDADTKFSQPTFSTRIIVSDGSNPRNNGELAQEPALDTTLGLEDFSDCESEEGNELVIITSAVLDSEPSMSQDDVEAPSEASEESRLEKKPVKKGGQTQLVFLRATVISELDCGCQPATSR